MKKDLIIKMLMDVKSQHPSKSGLEFLSAASEYSGKNINTIYQYINKYWEVKILYIKMTYNIW